MLQVVTVREWLAWILTQNKKGCPLLAGLQWPEDCVSARASGQPGHASWGQPQVPEKSLQLRPNCLPACIWCHYIRFCMAYMDYNAHHCNKSAKSNPPQTNTGCCHRKFHFESSPHKIWTKFIVASKTLLRTCSSINGHCMRWAWSLECIFKAKSEHVGAGLVGSGFRNITS